MKTELTTLEWDALHFFVTGEEYHKDGGKFVGGAWLNACAEFLISMGYIYRNRKATPDGIYVLSQRPKDV